MDGWVDGRLTDKMHEFWYVGKTEVRSGERKEESEETAWGQTTQDHVSDFKKLEIILR